MEKPGISESLVNKETGFPEEAVKRNIRQLEKEGLIKKDRDSLCIA